jgi:hypothetical protein
MAAHADAGQGAHQMDKEALRSDKCTTLLRQDFGPDPNHIGDPENLKRLGHADLVGAAV